MLYNFLEVVVKDIEGTIVTNVDLNKLIANSIYNTTRDIGMVTIAQNMHQGQDVEFTPEQIEEVKGIVKANFVGFVQKAIEEYFGMKANPPLPVEPIAASADEDKDSTEEVQVVSEYTP